MLREDGGGGAAGGGGGETGAAGGIELGLRESKEADESGRCSDFLAIPIPNPPPAPPAPPAPFPRERLGVADLDPGGVSVGEEVPDPALGVVVVLVVVDEPNSSKRLSSYLRCFSSRSLAARALCSSMVSCFFLFPLRSSPSSEETSPPLRLVAVRGPSLDSSLGGGLKSPFGTMPRVSRK